ncbi:lipocalin [Aquicoccus sp. SCR17]|nr:lipocalin [Carideicomes alvinocaridis]
MRRAVLAALCAGLAVAGCGERPAPVEPAPMVSSSLRFDLARFAGDWVVRQATAGAGPVRAISVLPEGPERFAWREGTGAQVVERAGRVTGPGRLALSGPGGERAIWVLWVDEGFRTAALGAPDGSLGLILDRAETGGADRIEAAREMMDFNGFDRSRLRGME